jgi:chromosome segregation ATPase
MNKTETEQPKSRREAVWEVCDQLSAQGIKPSLRSVKMHYPRGSDTDVQKDVNGWFEHVFAQHARRRVIPTLPESVVKAMEAFWETASLEADNQFAKERKAHEDMRSEMREKLDSVLAELAQSKAAATKSEQDNVDLRLELSHRSTLLSDAEEEIKVLRRDLDELRRHLQKRDMDHQEELSHLRDTHERNLKAQREDFELQVKLVREAAAKQAEEHDRAMKRADDHYRDLERRSLMEIDSMRTRAKSAEELIERQRNTVHEREIELVELRTELRLIRETQQAQIDDLAKRNSALTSQLEQLQAKIERQEHAATGASDKAGSNDLPNNA